MFKVHIPLSSIQRNSKDISKHFMFKVHDSLIRDNLEWILFQNISCLRFIDSETKAFRGALEFQNISCLRFMIVPAEYIELLKTFQNISCLRFIYNRRKFLFRQYLISKHFMFKVHKNNKRRN